MGARNATYGDSCRSARFVARHGEALSRIRAEYSCFDTTSLEEAFLAALHEMTPRALRDIADAIDPALPAT